MKYLTLFFLSFSIMIPNMGLFAQNKNAQQDIDDVMLTINKLFDGMREGDSAKVASTFDQSVNMYTSFTNKKGERVVKKGSLAPFLKAIGTPHDEIWDEKIMNTKISIDGNIAQVWTDYVFYVGSEFSHCGIDALHLIKNEQYGWKIVHLMDTRRKEGCELTNK